MQWFLFWAHFIDLYISSFQPICCCYCCTFLVLHFIKFLQFALIHFFRSFFFSFAYYFTFCYVFIYIYLFLISAFLLLFHDIFLVASCVWKSYFCNQKLDRDDSILKDRTVILKYAYWSLSALAVDCWYNLKLVVGNKEKRWSEEHLLRTS